MGHRLWLPAVAIHRLGIVEIAPSPHYCFRMAHPRAQSVKGSPTEPVLSRSSRQRLGQLQSNFDGGWHVWQAVFPEPQSAAACRRVERRSCSNRHRLMLTHTTRDVHMDLTAGAASTNLKTQRNPRTVGTMLDRELVYINEY